MRDKPNKITAELKVVVTEEFYDDDLTEETLRYFVEQDLKNAGFDVDVSVLKEQEAKTGHWTISEYEYLDCSCCGNSYYTGCDSTEEAKMRLKKGFYFKYCPFCGAKMEGR